MKASLAILSAALLLATTGTLASAQEKAAAPAAPSLYDRLGGIYAISAVVDDFIERVYANATLNANPNVAKARNEARKPGLKVQVANLVCIVTGGPCKYTGQGMKETHANFHITQKEWDALLVEFRACLDKFKVPPAEQNELVAIVESTKADIVEGAPPPTKK
ncbi:MAG: group 1 truncated hemoglobin [Candidatus Eisenbacteria bacterium]